MKITGLSLVEPSMSHQSLAKELKFKFSNKFHNQHDLRHNNSLYYSKIQVPNDESNESQKLLHTNQSNKEQNTNEVEILKETEIEFSERVMSSPEFLAKEDFILKKKNENQTSNKFGLFHKPLSSSLVKCSFNLNKNCLIQSLNNLNAPTVNKCEDMYFEDSEECPNDTFSDTLTQSYSDENSAPSSFDIEPYLRKFEKENLNNSKFNMIKHLKPKKSIQLSPKVANKEASTLHKSIYSRESHDLFRLTQNCIPWEKIDPKSKNLMLEFVISNKVYLLDDYDHEIDFNIYGMNGHKIKNKKVKEWISILKDNYLFKMVLVKRLNNMSRLGSSKRSHLVLPINDDELYSNRVRLHTNEEIFDELSEDSYVSDSSTQSDSDDKDILYTKVRNQPIRNISQKYQPINETIKNPEPDNNSQFKKDVMDRKSSEMRMSYQDWCKYMLEKAQNDSDFDMEKFIRPKECHSEVNNTSHKIEKNEIVSGSSSRSESNIQNKKCFTDNLCSKSLIQVEYQAKSSKNNLKNDALNTTSQIYIKDCKKNNLITESKYKKIDVDSSLNPNNNLNQLDIHHNNSSNNKIDDSKSTKKTDNLFLKNQEANFLTKIFSPKKFQMKNSQNKYTKQSVSVLYPSIENMIYSNNMRVSSKMPKDQFRPTNSEPPPRPPPPQKMPENPKALVKEYLEEISCTYKCPPTPLPCRSTLFSRIQLNSRN